MAEEEEEEQTDGKAGGGKPILLILIIALVAIGIGVGAGFVLFNEEPAAEAGEASTEDEAENASDDDSAETFSDRLLQLQPIVVNIDGDGYTRLLKLSLAFECSSPAARNEAEERMLQIKDAVLTLVSSKRLADVADFEGKALLKDDLRDRVNHLLNTGEVDSVLITEFVVQ